jgi:methionyl-tRNA formyltransferase
VAQADYQGKTMRIWETQVLDHGHTAKPGNILAADKQGIEVATGQGVLRIVRLQMPGKRAMSAADFLNAHVVDGAALG